MSDRLIFLNSNDGTGLLAYGSSYSYIHSEHSSFEKIQSFIDAHQGDYIFHMLSYDLKNQIEKLNHTTHNFSDFPYAIFWVPECVIQLEYGGYKLLKGKENAEILELINRIKHNEPNSETNTSFQLHPRTTREDYLRHVKELIDELQYGNIYEINYCQEYFKEDVQINDPFSLYFRLNAVTQAPFSAYVQFDDYFIFCGSPERYLKKIGEKLISQPIKGTIKKGANEIDDQRLIDKLRNDPKEISENVMIVDLVRNDLSRIAQKNSVYVSELCGIYSFKTVHQMISTVECSLNPNVNWSDIIKATFPMGSMTGAPKISAMNICDKHEDFSRGIYSGSIGYINPDGDFDMNVVIRSVYYNSKTNYISCGVGGAITIKSIPENEYEECQTKVAPILNCLNGQY